MDGRVLDELIHKKVEDYNTRWDELMQRVGTCCIAAAETLSIFIGFSHILNLFCILMSKTGSTKATAAGEELAVGPGERQNPAPDSGLSEHH